MKIKGLVRGPRQILLDALFTIWLSYALITGNVIPDPVADLLRNQPPAVVITDPDAENDAPGGDSDAPGVPELYLPGSGVPQAL
jgi:hypothetical protein